MGTLTAAQIWRFHCLVIAALGVAYAIVVVGDQLGHSNLFGLAGQVRVDMEGNFPSLFSALALLATATAAAAVRGALPHGSRERSRWTFLAALFVVLAIDEAVQLHELIARPAVLDGYLHLFMSFGVFPYAGLAAFLAWWLFDFWREQEPRVRIRMAGAGALYVAAAIGMEINQNYLSDAGVSRRDLRMSISFALEELGEMLAVAIFLNAFLLRFAATGGGLLVPLRSIWKKN